MNKDKQYRINEFCLIPPPYGGVTVYVKRLSDQLQKDGYSVGGYYSEECKEPKVLESPDYYKAIVSMSSSKVVRAFVQIIRMICNMYELSHFDLIHYHGLENLKLIWILKNFLRKKIIITVHSTMIEGFYNKTSAINRFFMKKLADSDAQWIAVSEQAKQCMLNLPINFHKDIPVVAAYVPIESQSDKPLSREMMTYINAHKKNIAFYGRSFMINEGIDVYGFEDALILYKNIVERIEDSVGLIFCLSEDRDQAQIQKLFKIAKTLGIYSKIYWQIGAIDNINTLWKTIDIYIRPTSTDGDSVAVREVLDLGVHVVASDVCWRPEGVITYAWNNADSLFQKVQFALSIPKKEPKQNYACYNAMKSLIDNYLENR